MFKIKILKFYYKLSYGQLPKYFNSYIHKLEEEPARVLRCNIVLYCIVLYCMMRPYTDGPIGPLSYRHSSGVVRNPRSALAE